MFCSNPTVGFIGMRRAVSLHPDLGKFSISFPVQFLLFPLL